MQKEAAAAVCSAASLFLFLHMDMKNTSQFSMVIGPIRIYHLTDPAVVDLVANAPDPVLLAFRLLGDFPLCTGGSDGHALLDRSDQVIVAVNVRVDFRARHSNIIRHM